MKRESKDMDDLKKVEKKFHEYLKARLDEKIYRIDEIRVTKDLLEKEAAFYIPFGWISYFLVIEDGKPAVYAHACSRMDLDTVAFIDEDGFEDHDVWGNYNPDMAKKYSIHARNVKRFNYKEDLKFISDVER